jgi:hypothetical protein
MSGQRDVGAWQDFLDAVKGCETRLLAAAPDAATATEALVYLGRLTSSILSQMLSPGDRTIGGIYYAAAKIGGQNPDYHMGVVQIDPAGVYRVTGAFNDATRVGLGIYTPGPQAALDLDDYHAVWAKDGKSFSVTIGGEGGQMKALPSSKLLMIRELQLLPGKKRAEIALERLDVVAQPESPAAPSEEKYAATMAAAIGQLVALVDQFIRWSNIISESSNAVTRMPDELDRVVRGDAQTLYYTGHFDLEPDQALEIDFPETDADYWMIQATNHWLEPIPGASRNIATIDKSTRSVIIAARDPGKPNWLDIGGRRHGQILARTVGSDIVNIPKSRLVQIT